MEWLLLNDDLESSRPRERVRVAAWEYPFLFKMTQTDFNDESFVEKLNAAELLQKQEAGAYDTWNDKWIIQNVEPGFNKVFNDKDRNTHSGYGTKVLFGTFSKRARKYYNHKTGEVGKIKDLRR